MADASEAGEADEAAAARAAAGQTAAKATASPPPPLAPTAAAPAPAPAEDVKAATSPSPSPPPSAGTPSQRSAGCSRLHRGLARLEPYAAARFPDMYAIWAGEVLQPAELQGQATRRTRAAREAVASVMLQVADDNDTEAFWLAATFCARSHRHLVEADRRGEPSLVGRGRGRGGSKVEA